MKMRLVSGLIFSMLSCAIFGQVTLFSDDFNSCNLSEKWSYTLTGNQNVSWGVGFPSNPKASGSSIDSTCMLFVDDDLTGDKTAPYKLRLYSSYFNGSNFSEILFSAQVHFRRDKTEYLRIIIDNGKKEHIIKEFKGTNYSGNLFSNSYNMNADISFVASDSMRIIIEYDDDNHGLATLVAAGHVDCSAVNSSPR